MGTGRGSKSNDDCQHTDFVLLKNNLSTSVSVCCQIKGRNKTRLHPKLLCPKDLKGQFFGPSTKKYTAGTWQSPSRSSRVNCLTSSSTAVTHFTWLRTPMQHFGSLKLDISVPMSHFQNTPDVQEYICAPGRVTAFLGSTLLLLRKRSKGGVF